MIDLDFSFFIQLVNFLISLVLINTLIVSPVRSALARRRAAMDGLLTEAEKFAADADAKLKNYEVSLAEAHKEGGVTRDALKDEGHAREMEILASANKTAQDEVSATKQQVATEVKAAMDTLKAQVDGLATKATEKVLG